MAGAAKIVLYHLRLRRLGLPVPGGAGLQKTIFFIQVGDSLGEACPMAQLRESVHETGAALEHILADLPTRIADTPAAVAAWLKHESPMLPSARNAAEMVAYASRSRAMWSAAPAYWRALACLARANVDHHAAPRPGKPGLTQAAASHRTPQKIQPCHQFRPMSRNHNCRLH